ncbi:hypothetical protein DV736_g349, partial [Chaetothyriales sp. CBS 134916]
MSSQREAYQLPARAQQTSSGGYTYGDAAGDSSAAPLVTYKCGECDRDVRLAKGDTVRCEHCGHRVLYKQRTVRMVQFEAR